MKALQHTYKPVYQTSGTKSFASRFFTWCESQEKYRFGWLAGIIAGHGCFITPATLLFVMMAGNSPVLWAFVIASMGMALVTNLAALPTKITIPVFFLSVLIDLIVIINCLA
jgi:hypothetical protein